MALTAQDLELLAFERSWWQHEGPKARAIEATLGISPSAYYGRLRALVDDDEAATADPLLIRRLRRDRAARRRTRYEGPARQRSHR